MANRKKQVIGLFFALVPALFALDRVTKYWANTFLRAMPGGQKALIPGLIGFLYAENTGAAFSFMRNNTILLTVFTFLLVVGVFLYILLNRSMGRGMTAALWAVFAGGAGNLYDRIAYGYVVDFFEVQFMRFAIFNVADVYITCGAVLFCVLLLFEARGGEKKGVVS